MTKMYVLVFISICFVTFTTVFTPFPATCTELTPVTRIEIAHLLDFMEQSQCEFFRNGTWYKDAKAIREHAELKTKYFLNKGKIKTAEDCITWAGSKSELSGKPYMVKCGSKQQEPTAQWLTRELNHFRIEAEP